MDAGFWRSRRLKIVEAARVEFENQAMSDDWCLPDYTPTPPARRRPAETVWTATINDRPFTA